MTITKRTRKSAASVAPARPAKPAAKAAAAKPVVATATAKPAQLDKAPTAAKVKHKLVRDSFTIPKTEYLVLEALKQRAAKLTRPTKKSELLRAGIVVLQGMGDKEFLAALTRVPSLKTGRPKAEVPPAQ
jgi:hypothetical protein